MASLLANEFDDSAVHINVDQLLTLTNNSANFALQPTIASVYDYQWKTEPALFNGPLLWDPNTMSLIRNPY